MCLYQYNTMIYRYITYLVLLFSAHNHNQRMFSANTIIDSGYIIKIINNRKLRVLESTILTKNIEIKI